MSKDFDVNIKTTADLKAAEDAAKAARELGKETAQAGEAAKKASEKQKQLKNQLDDTEGSADTVYYLMNGMRDLASGQVVTGIQDLATGMKNLTASVLANPVGIAVAAVTALGGALAAWRSKVKQQKADMEEDRKAFADYSRDLNKAREEVDSYTDSINASLQDAGDGAKAFAGETVLDALLRKLNAAADAAGILRSHTEALVDADLGLEMAKIDYELARGNISEEEANARRAGARSAAASRRDTAREKEIEDRLKIAQDREAKTGRGFSAAVNEQGLAEENLYNVRKQIEKVGKYAGMSPQRLDDEIKKLDEELKKDEYQATFKENPLVAAAAEKRAEKTARELEKAKFAKVLNTTDAEGKATQRVNTANDEVARLQRDLAAARGETERLQAEKAQNKDVTGRNQQARFLQEETRKLNAEQKRADEELAAAKAKADAKDKEIERQRKEAEQAAEKAQEERRRKNEESLKKETADVLNSPDILPGTVGRDDLPGLGSDRQARSANEQIRNAADALNTARDRAGSDGAVSPEELEALYGLLGDFVALARQMGSSQKNSLEQAEQFRQELEDLRAQLGNRP